MSNVESELKRVSSVYERRRRDGVFSKYSLFRPGELFIQQRREAVVLDALSQAGLHELAGLRILEIGCGRGQRLADFQRWGARPENLFGVDLLPSMVQEAAHGYPQFRLAVASGHQLPLRSETFDIVMQSTVFTSITSHELKRTLASEMLRVLTRDGVILWYDFRYPSPINPNVKAIGPSEIRSLFPGTRQAFRTLTLLPPLARALAPHARWICGCLEAIPVLRSHCLAIIWKTQRQLT